LELISSIYPKVVPIRVDHFSETFSASQSRKKRSGRAKFTCRRPPTVFVRGEVRANLRIALVLVVVLEYGGYC
jgi:hypothetical protein